MRYILILIFSVSAHSISAQIGVESLKSVTKKAKSVFVSKKTTNEEIARGLREALTVGASNSVKNASEKGGFNDNSMIKIQFPPQAEKIKKTLSSLGKESEIKRFEVAINEAAEHASKSALLIFENAIKTMSIQDATTILQGGDNAATDHLRNKTYKLLCEQFKPIVEKSIEKVHLATYWNTITRTYNAIPLTKKIDPNLEEYITNKTIDGLFILIAQEEKVIRNNPQARVSEILRKVFR